MIFFCLLSAIVASIVILVHALSGWLLAVNLDDTPAGNSYRQRTPPVKAKEGEAVEEGLPKVAVLIAARNEEENLNRCICALEQLHYPRELLTIWIGNDNSSDATLKMVQDLCRGKFNCFVLDIKEQWEGLKGKTNVLAQLAAEAAESADYFFITDADVRVLPGWVMNMISYFSPEVAMVNGTTLVEGHDWMGHMQRNDWLLSSGLLKAYSLLPGIGSTVTAMGNNLAVRKDAYKAVGGFEGIPFSITEDFELNRQLNLLGYKTSYVAGSGTKAFTLPAEKFSDLLHQRKRWMAGAMELPFLLKFVLICQVLFIPSVLLLLFFLPLLGTALLLIKLLTQLFVARQMSSRLKESSVFPFLGYELYSFVLNTCLLVFYYLPIKIQWKGRKY